MLGPFDVVVDGRSVQLGGAKQRALLAILALSAVWITGALTGEQNPPQTAPNRPADNAAPF